jgi:DNA mismatch repair ATPase MutL
LRNPFPAYTSLYGKGGAESRSFLYSAIKLGDELSHQEMEALIQDWLTSRYPATCPHGRSICYRLDHKDIARKLDRH